MRSSSAFSGSGTDARYSSNEGIGTAGNVPAYAGGLRITDSAVSLNVADVEASASFAQRHFAFEEAMSGDGFASLTRDDAGFNLVFLRTGLPTFKPAQLHGRRADGLLVVFVVDDVDAEYARLRSEGVEITTPLQTEPWGERFFQVTDPNGVTYQLVQWVS